MPVAQIPRELRGEQRGLQGPDRQCPQGTQDTGGDLETLLVQTQAPTSATPHSQEVL